MGDYTTQLYVRIMIRQHARSGLKLPPFFHRKRGMVLTVKAVTTVTLGIGSTTFRKRCRRQGSEWKIFWPIHGHLSCSRLIKHWAGCKLQTWLFLEIRLVFCVSNDTLLMTHRFMAKHLHTLAYSYNNHCWSQSWSTVLMMVIQCWNLTSLLLTYRKLFQDVDVGRGSAVLRIPYWRWDNHSQYSDYKFPILVLNGVMGPL